MTTLFFSKNKPPLFFPAVLFIAFCLFSACRDDANKKNQDAPQAPTETVQDKDANPPEVSNSDKGSGVAEADQDKQPGSGSNSPTPGTGQNNTGAREIGTNQDGKGNGSADQATSSSYTVLDWQGGVTIYGKNPQKGQPFNKDAVRFSKTSDFLLVKDEKGATFFILPEGYDDDEEKAETCAQHQCIPTLLAISYIGSTKRLSKWYKSKTNEVPSPGVEPEKKLNQVSPKETGKKPIEKPNTVIKNAPQPPKIKELQKTKQFRQQR